MVMVQLCVDMVWVLYMSGVVWAAALGSVSLRPFMLACWLYVCDQVVVAYERQATYKCSVQFHKVCRPGVDQCRGMEGKVWASRHGLSQ